MALLWCPSADDYERAIIHGPRYEDWTFPKVAIESIGPVHMIDPETVDDLVLLCSYTLE